MNFQNTVIHMATGPLGEIVMYREYESGKFAAAVERFPGKYYPVFFECEEPEECALLTNVEVEAAQFDAPKKALDFALNLVYQ